MTHAYGHCAGVRYLTNGLKARCPPGVGPSLPARPLYPPMHGKTVHRPARAPTARAPIAIQVYYAPRRPVYAQSTLPTVAGNMRLLRTVLLRERISLLHAHQAFSALALEALVHARTMGYRVRLALRHRVLAARARPRLQHTGVARANSQAPRRTPRAHPRPCSPTTRSLALLTRPPLRPTSCSRRCCRTPTR